MSSDAKCPVTGSAVSALPPDHPKVNGGGVCPVTAATTEHHNNVVHEHPPVPQGSSEKDCPVLRAAKESNTCPVVGTNAAALPPNHPAPESLDGQVCPVTHASKAHHQNVVHEHPAVPKNASAKDCPVLSANSVAAAKADAEKAASERCPVTGSKVTSLPPDHPSVANGGVCPVTKASVDHHENVQAHPKVPKGASAKDCPVLQDNECPVVGTNAAALPPNHPTKTTGTCPVTGAKAEHHNGSVHQHPDVASTNDAAVCPVTGASAGSHANAAPSNGAPAQCPVTGQYADGSRPAVQIPAHVAAQPITFTVLGNPFSTYTRTLTMGLHECGISNFTQRGYLPYAKEVYEHNPFGRIPVLLVGHGGQELAMHETESIVRYLDASNSRVLRFKPEELLKNQKLEEWTSIVTSYVFGAVEGGVVKPTLKDANADVSAGLEKMHEVLKIVETRMQGPYLMGMPTTWPDLFLYPILADLKASKHGAELQKYPKLAAWTERMSKRKSALATKEGTLEVLGGLPK
ncbi:hypothetical protein PYCC9005_001264 [Savitreella phatthalungensis]